MKSESCVVINLSEYRAKREREALAKKISALACDREKLPYNLDVFKTALLAQR